MISNETFYRDRTIITLSSKQCPIVVSDRMVINMITALTDKHESNVDCISDPAALSVGTGLKISPRNQFPPSKLSRLRAAVQEMDEDKNKSN